MTFLVLKLALIKLGANVDFFLLLRGDLCNWGYYRTLIEVVYEVLECHVAFALPLPWNVQIKIMWTLSGISLQLINNVTWSYVTIEH